jgi:hypothetical protein
MVVSQALGRAVLVFVLGSVPVDSLSRLFSSAPVQAMAIRNSSLRDVDKGAKLVALVKAGMTRKQVEGLLGSTKQPEISWWSDTSAYDCWWAEYRIEVTFDFVHNTVIGIRHRPLSP